MSSTGGNSGSSLGVGTGSSTGSSTGNVSSIGSSSPVPGCAVVGRDGVPPPEGSDTSAGKASDGNLLGVPGFGLGTGAGLTAG